MTTLEQPTLKISLPVVIRVATQQDLPRLEWYGQYIHFRNLFRRAYRDQQLGTRLMLVADCNGFPIGHIFILFMDDELGNKQAYFYSLRVMDMFHSQGIGTHLLIEAETHVLARGYHYLTIAAAKTNHAARRLYERLGYEVFMDDRGEWSYTDHLGKVRQVKGHVGCCKKPFLCVKMPAHAPNQIQSDEFSLIDRLCVDRRTMKGSSAFHEY